MNDHTLPSRECLQTCHSEERGDEESTKTVLEMDSSQAQNDKLVGIETVSLQEEGLGGLNKLL